MTSPTFFFFGGIFCKFNHIIFVVLLYTWANIKKCYKCNINRSKEQRVLPSIPQLKWVTLLLVLSKSEYGRYEDFKTSVYILIQKKKKLHLDQAGKQIVFPIAESQTFE